MKEVSEGELKKRVRERWLNVPYSWVEHFEEVLDEAKQNFPKFIRVKDPDFERIFKEKAYVWDDREFNPQKISEWFEKWFGGAEK